MGATQLPNCSNMVNLVLQSLRISRAGFFIQIKKIVVMMVRNFAVQRLRARTRLPNLVLPINAADEPMSALHPEDGSRPRPLLGYCRDERSDPVHRPTPASRFWHTYHNLVQSWQSHHSAREVTNPHSVTYRCGQDCCGFTEQCSLQLGAHIGQSIT